MISPDEPYALKSEEERLRRAELLVGGHMVPLVSLLGEIRVVNAATPNFDPCDGGIKAMALFLLEAPGRKAKGSDFISRNNPDQTAKNMCGLLYPLRREDVILWNIVPWYLGSQEKIAPAKRSDISAARSFLVKLFTLLPDLEFVILMGKPARSEREVIAELLAKADRGHVEIRETVHPSPKVLNTQPHQRQAIAAVIDEIGRKIGFK